MACSPLAPPPLICQNWGPSSRNRTSLMTEPLASTPPTPGNWHIKSPAMERGIASHSHAKHTFYFTLSLRHRKIAELAALLAGSDVPKSPLGWLRLQTLQSYDGRDVPRNVNPYCPDSGSHQQVQRPFQRQPPAYVKGRLRNHPLPWF